MRKLIITIDNIPDSQWDFCNQACKEEFKTDRDMVNSLEIDFKFCDATSMIMSGAFSLNAQIDIFNQIPSANELLKLQQSLEESLSEDNNKESSSAT